MSRLPHSSCTLFISVQRKSLLGFGAKESKKSGRRRAAETFFSELVKVPLEQRKSEEREEKSFGRKLIRSRFLSILCRPRIAARKEREQDSARAAVKCRMPKEKWGAYSVSEPLQGKKIGKGGKRPHCDFGAISCHEPTSCAILLISRPFMKAKRRERATCCSDGLHDNRGSFL